MHVRALNAAAEGSMPPVLAPEGFTGGVDRAIFHRSRLTRRLVEARHGRPLRPSSRIAVVCGSGIDRKAASSALKDPSASGLPVYELVPPASSRILSVVSGVALASTSALLLFGMTLAFVVPMGLKVVSVYYGGSLDGLAFESVRKVMDEPGFRKFKDDDNAKSRAFFDRYKEIRRELSN